jgi:hypothetical protein
LSLTIHQYRNRKPPLVKERRLSISGCPAFYDWKKSAFFLMKECHLAGTSSTKKIAETGQTGSQAAQSVQTAGSMYICSSAEPPCMQSTGQTSTQKSSLAPMQGSQITNAKPEPPFYL